MKKFVGLSMLTGIVRKPDLKSHWEVDPVTATPFFPQTMSRNRFLHLNRFLHFTNNDVPNNSFDKLVKVRPVIDHLSAKFKENYQLHQQVSIDEGTLKWKGRLGFKVYNPMKPIKYGIKGYMLADSKSSYCYAVLIYDGTTRPFSETVKMLMRPHYGRNHMLFMDNLYNSVKTAEELLENGVYVTGTLRRNRGEPAVVREAGTAGNRLEKGDSVDRDNGKVMVSAWQDQRTVLFISTQHDNSRKIVEVRQKGGQLAEVSKPTALVDYNKYMGGVDKIDQMISYYPVTRKTVKWPKKIFWWWVELSLHNACVLFNSGRVGKQRMPLLQFQKRVIMGLCQPEVDAPMERNNRETESSEDEDEEDPPLPFQLPLPWRQATVDSDVRLAGGFDKVRVINSFSFLDIDCVTNINVNIGAISKHKISLQATHISFLSHQGSHIPILNQTAS